MKHCEKETLPKKTIILTTRLNTNRFTNVTEEKAFACALSCHNNKRSSPSRSDEESSSSFPRQSELSTPYRLENSLENKTPMPKMSTSLTHVRRKCQHDLQIGEYGKLINLRGTVNYRVVCNNQCRNDSSLLMKIGQDGPNARSYRFLNATLKPTKHRHVQSPSKIGALVRLNKWRNQLSRNHLKRWSLCIPLNPLNHGQTLVRLPHRGKAHRWSSCWAPLPYSRQLNRNSGVREGETHRFSAQYKTELNLLLGTIAPTWQRAKNQPFVATKSPHQFSEKCSPVPQQTRTLC